MKKISKKAWMRAVTFLLFAGFLVGGYYTGVLFYFEDVSLALFVLLGTLAYCLLLSVLLHHIKHKDEHNDKERTCD